LLTEVTTGVACHADHIKALQRLLQSGTGRPVIERHLVMHEYQGLGSLGGRKSAGCNGRETGLAEHRLPRPGAYPGLVSATQRSSVFVHFAATPSAAQTPSGWAAW
jgi:hypothetical protein